MAMSVAMAQGMNALISVNSQLANLQTQATSGKKINSAADGLAAFLSATTYTNRASRLSGINDTLTSNLATIKAAQTGLSSIRSTISSTLDTLKAASQTQAYVAATNQVDTPTASTAAGASGSNTQVNLRFSAYDQNGNNLNNQVINGNTALVSPTGGWAVNNATVPPSSTPTSTLRLGGVTLAMGQVLKINNSYIRISGPAAANAQTNAPADTVTGNNDGSSATNALYVRTVSDLVTAIRSAAGCTTADTLMTAAANTNFNNVNIQENFQGSLTISQPAVPGVNSIPGNTLQTLITGVRGRQNTANFTSDDITNNSVTNGLASYTIGAQDHAITAGTGGQTADSRRAAAAKSYNLAMNQINQYLQAASVSGTNLLNGDNLKITFDERGNSTSFQIQNAAGTAMQFNAAGLNLVYAATNTSADTAANFATNEDAALDASGNSTLGLNAAINKLTAALSTLDLGDSQVAQFQATTTQNRSDFNKSMIQLLGDLANSLTAADMSAVVAQTASLQVQQGFAQTILANTKQSDQSVMQLLR